MYRGRAGDREKDRGERKTVMRERRRDAHRRYVMLISLFFDSPYVLTQVMVGLTYREQALCIVSSAQGNPGHKAVEFLAETALRLDQQPLVVLS